MPQRRQIHRDSSTPIVGQCQELEKSYFRLTTEVDPAKVRPEPVLKEAFCRLKKIWKESDRREYVLDQLKAIRQDLVVQGISDEFTVKVYEYNIKRAILCKNLSELNQVTFTSFLHHSVKQCSRNCTRMCPVSTESPFSHITFCMMQL